MATQEIGVVITSSPGPMPAMRKAISMVQVPELKVRTGRPPKYSRQLRFKGLDLRPAGDPAGAQDIADGGNGGFVDDRFGKRQERQWAHKALIIRGLDA